MTGVIDRTDVPYVWPRTLIAPDRPPMLIYLDLNHWVALSKAMVGHRDGAMHKPILDLCMAAMADGRAVFPLSDTIYLEVSKMHIHRQRRNLRLVMEALSGFAVVTSRDAVAIHEIEAVLDEAVGPNPHPVPKVNYLDRGVLRAFGRDGSLETGTVVDGIWSKLPPERGRLPEDVVRAADLFLQRAVIDGPEPGAEEAKLRSLGWDQTGTIQVATNRAQQEIDQVAVFDANPEWRRERLRDVVSAREIMIEINENLVAGLNARSAHLDEILLSLDDTRRFFDSMPSFDVAVTIKTRYHRNRQHRWKHNDVHDIDALGSTIPYCDVVVTDKAVAGHIHAAKLDQRLDTIVLSTLADLAALL